MITPSMPGWKTECVGDDIAWMFFDDEGQLRAVNPEYGFFGVCPGGLRLKSAIFIKISLLFDLYWLSLSCVRWFK